MSEREAPNPMTQVMKGMQVYDANGELIGEVNHVFAGPNHNISFDDLPFSESIDGDAVIVDANVPEIMNPERLPPELVERMRNEGYMHITRPGLQDIGTIILPDQIDSVSEQGIYLTP